MPGMPAGEPLGSLARRLAAGLRAIGDGLPAPELRATADALADAAAELHAVGTAAEPIHRAAHTLTTAHASVTAAARTLDQVRARLDGYATRALGIPGTRSTDGRAPAVQDRQATGDSGSTRTWRTRRSATTEPASHTGTGGLP